ncbi:MAG: type II toxin-antitoxin system VapC family toxin [Spirochaetota bacterium]
MIYLDTSAFLKLYVRESGSEMVQTIITSQSDPLPLWDILQAEMLNAFRLKVFWGELDQSESERLIRLFDDRLQRGQYFAMEVDRHRLLTAFRELSGRTPKTGCRTMDIFHVACALQAEARQFVSFDARQRALAASAGLSVLPED